MPRRLAAQIQAIYTWAVISGPPNLIKSVASAEALMSILRQLSSYALSQPNGPDIKELPQVLTEDSICDWVDWRLDERENLPSAIMVSLRWLCALVDQHGLFNGGDYTWLRRKVNSIIDEPRWVKKERKRQKLVPPQLLLDVPAKIRSDRLAASELTSKQFARSLHNELFMSMPPWRSQNHCGISLTFNIVESEMTDDRWNQLTYIPAWVHEQLKNNEHRRFVFIHFVESEMKGKKEIWEVMDRGTEDLYREFLDHRHLLLRKNEKDHGSLFVNANGRPMKKPVLRRLMLEITTRYLPKPLAPHLRRDCVVIAMIVAGATFEQIGAVLQHGWQESTNAYTPGLSAVSCAEALEREVAKLAVELGLDFT